MFLTEFILFSLKLSKLLKLLLSVLQFEEFYFNVLVLLT